MRLSPSENPSEAEDADPADEEDGVDEDQYPWEDVDKARHNQRLQRKHPPGEADKYRATADLAARRNELVAALADELWFAHITPAGRMEPLAKRFRQSPPAR